MDYQFGIQLDQDATAPLYRQIADQIRDQVRRGVLPVGFRLPPTRDLAAQLQTHRNTVVRAFDELADAGVITAQVGRGTFVAPLSPRAPMIETPSHLPWASLLSRRGEALGDARIQRLQRALAAGQVINLQRMQASVDLLPVEPFRRCVDHVLRTTKGRALGYAPREGLPSLREHIAGELARLGVPARPEEVLVTSGSQQALDLIARALIDPGDSFLVEEATYSGAINLLSAHGANLIGVPCDADGPLLHTLSGLAARGAKGFYVMPNARNPTGSTMTADRRHQLVRWSRTSGTPLIEDDYGADLNLDGEPTPPSLRALDPDVLHVATFSKKLIPALRIGFVVCPRPVFQRLVSLKHASDLGASLLMQHALAEFLDRGYLRAHLKNVVSAYRARRDALEEALSQHLPSDVTFAHTARGVATWLQLPGHIDPEAVFEEALKRGVLVTPGTLSTVGEQAQRGIRLTFCAEAPDRIAEGAKRLAEALEHVLQRAKHRRPTRREVPELGVV